MSDTHAQTARAQADVQQADVQARKPHIPPGHVEAERPVRRLGGRQIRPFAGWLGAALVLIVIIAAVVIAAT